MNDLPQYFKQNNCPGVVLGNQSLNCLMYADDLLVISPSPEGLQQSIHKHTQDWKLKVNTKKSNIIIFSGNRQNNNEVNFKYENEILQIVEKQSYLGIEITSSCRFSMQEKCKKAIKVLSIINRSFSKTDAATIAIKNKLFNALVKPVLLYACEIWGPELLSYKTPFDKSTTEQVHIKFFIIQLSYTV